MDRKTTMGNQRTGIDAPIYTSAVLYRFVAANGGFVESLAHRIPLAIHLIARPKKTARYSQARFRPRLTPGLSACSASALSCGYSAISAGPYLSGARALAQL